MLFLFMTDILYCILIREQKDYHKKVEAERLKMEVIKNRNKSNLSIP